MKRKFIKNVGWLGLLRFFSQFFVFVKLTILARVLTPEDFGLFALITTIINSLEALTETGFNYAAIYFKDSFKRIAPTLFFVNTARGFILSVVLIIFAEPISVFFNNKDLVQVFLIASIIPILKGLENPYTILFQKDQNFKKEFIFRVTPVIFASLFSIYFGLLFKSISGLVYGLLAGVIIELLISYLLIKGSVFKKPDFKILKKLFSYGKWLSIGGIFNFLNSQVDSLFIGKVFGSYALGLYDVAFKLATLVTTEINDTISKVLFPHFASIQNDKNRIKRNYISVVIALAIPATVSVIIFSLIPVFIINLLFGSQWLDAAPLLSILAFYGFLRSITGPAGPLLLASGKPRILTVMSVLNLTLISLTIIPLSNLFGVMGVAYSMTFSYLVISLIFLYLIINKFTNEKTKKSRS